MKKSKKEAAEATALVGRAKEVEEECWVGVEGLVRVVALLLDGVAKDSPVLKELKSRGIIPRLVGLLPQEAGAGAPRPSIRPHLCCNVTKILIPCSLDAPQAPTSTTTAASPPPPSSFSSSGGNISLQMFQAGVVERSIFLLANAPDGPVRQNSGILLARMSRNAMYMEKIRALRGMEMLRELGNKLVGGK